MGGDENDGEIEGNYEINNELTASGAMISKTLRELEKEIRMRGKLESLLHKKKLHGIMNEEREEDEDIVKRSILKNNHKNGILEKEIH